MIVTVVDSPSSIPFPRVRATELLNFTGEAPSIEYVALAASFTVNVTSIEVPLNFPLAVDAVIVGLTTNEGSYLTYFPV